MGNYQLRFEFRIGTRVEKIEKIGKIGKVEKIENSEKEKMGEIERDSRKIKK